MIKRPVSHRPKIDRCPSIFGISSSSYCVHVIDPGRAEAQMVPLRDEKFFTKVNIINGFGGESQITVFMTGRQDGRTDVMVVRSDVDGVSSVMFHDLINTDQLKLKVPSVLNKMWS